MLDSLAIQLNHYLTLVSERQRLVSSNIANADTPGYKTQDIDFASELNNSISSAATASEVPGLKIKNDGNNVDLDREARLMAENDLRFTVGSNLLHSDLKQLRMAIDGGNNSSS